ncbi:MAG: sigma-E factor negative regulatory protein [Betaproteobacteria bacterium]|nr:MAG: sigma-E factor negative regulatory protein [Betaproteobacteria bacterium]
MERLSALMDGELDDHEVAGELANIKGDPQREVTWAAYHLIGDVLRGEGVVADDFTVRVHVKLNDEPTVLAPRTWRPRTSRRVVLPLAASLCGAAVVAWLALSNNAVLSPQDNPVSPTDIVTAPPTGQIADASETDAMSDYLMAHQQFSPSTAMQGVVPYVRTVSAVDGSR